MNAALVAKTDRINRATAIAELARAGTGLNLIPLPLSDLIGRSPITPQGTALMLQNADGDQRVVDLLPHMEPYFQRPLARKGTATALTLLSFIDLVNRHKGVSSAVFGDPNWRKPTATAVIDYHDQVPEPGSDDRVAQPADSPPSRSLDPYARHGKHRIHYAFPLDEAWQAWVKIHDRCVNGLPLDQHEFAEWIEDHIMDIGSPTAVEEAEIKRLFGATVATGADMMTLSRGLEVNEKVAVKTAVKLASGEGEIQFERAHTDKAGGAVKVPGFFMLNVPVFYLGDPVTVPVRLRYRVSEGVVTWLMLMHRPDIHVTGAVQAAFDKIRTETNLPLYEGSAEMPAA